QAEDGIRDGHVTGVQTCALPISGFCGESPKKPADEQFPILPPKFDFKPDQPTGESDLGDDFDNFGASRAWFAYAQMPLPPLDLEIERASCRERVWSTVCAG